MQELERALDLAMPERVSNVNPEARAAALKYLDDLRDSSEGWKLAVMKLFQTNQEFVQFYCFVVVQNLFTRSGEPYHQLVQSDQFELRRALLTFLQQHVKTPFSISIRNNFFDDLIQAVVSNDANSGNEQLAMADMFLRIMASINDLLISQDVPRSREDQEKQTFLKDTMRAHANENLVRVWYWMLTKYKEVPQLVLHTLQCLKLFIHWIDINFIVNEQMMGAIMSFTSKPQLGEEVIDCLIEVVEKGMPLDKKLSLISGINIIGIIESVPLVDSDEMVDLLTRVGVLLSTTGSRILHHLPYHEDPGLSESAFNWVCKLFPVALKYFQHVDDGISETVVNFVNEYINVLKKAKRANATIPQHHMENLGQLLQALAVKARYDEEFDFENREDSEELFLKFRKHLGNIFRALTQLEPNLVLHSLAQQLRVAVELSKSPVPAHIYDLEVFLWMFYKVGESISESNLNQSRDFFVGVIEQLTMCNIPGHPHSAVSTMYWDSVNRYAKLLEGHQQLIGPIIICLTDARGIRNPRRRIQSRCCEAFVHLARTLKRDLASLLRELVERMRDLLAVTMQSPIEQYDRLNLYEGLGILIGSMNFEVQQAEQDAFLKVILTPLIQTLTQAAQSNFPPNIDDSNPAIQFISDLVYSVGTLSKGFPQAVRTTNPNVVTYFQPVLEIIIFILEKLPSNLKIKATTLFYVHRMIPCMGPAIFYCLNRIISLLMSSASLVELLDVLTVINQIISTFKQQVKQVADELFVPLSKHIFDVIQHSLSSGVTEKSEEMREINQLRRLYYTFIQTLVLSGLMEVFVSQNNFNYLLEVAEKIRQGCLLYDDTSLQLVCFSVFRKLIPLAGMHQPFSQYLIEVLIRTAFEVPVNPEFSLTDASSLNVLLEICHFMLELFRAAPQAVQAYLMGSIFPKLSAMPPLQQAFIEQLSSAKPQQFRAFMREFFVEFRRQKGA